ncbi:DUF411 domain-containing protein [Roseofilum casamattae]|uniref:DUF411 domain-containing protein n=1 Tax=Roseofilum casamattae BLCC-M143 TaxID=3022442 RepID=A0ABT7BR40_9CYAN|nr:DUF411 domain-containing protein [Roseofilum casamattae]MDJ1181666.1 DUF411 domain-containing protein [Roseofilum casamattae BLCC-M143]
MKENFSLHRKKIAIAGISLAVILTATYGLTNRNAPDPVAAEIAPVSVATVSDSQLKMTIYRTPTCGCCEGWMQHMEEQNFEVSDRILSNDEIDSIREQHNLPKSLSSCHTAVINGYLVEGHVPAADVKQLIAQKPDIAGIAVPGMPIGTPGMEIGDRKESFEVLGFTSEGKISTFNSYTY